MNLEELDVPALHRLEAANSRLRHGVVEACFYNLRMLAQELPGRRSGNGGFMDNLAEALDKIADARHLIDEYLNHEVAPGLRIRDLFEAESRAVSASLADLVEGGRLELPPRDNAAACRQFAERIVGDVDDILAAVDRIRKAVGDRRIHPADVMEELCRVQRATCEAEGVTLDRLSSHAENATLVFADRTRLLDALSELVRNALKYAFPACHNGEKRIALGIDVDGETRDTIITVSDTGCGMTPDRLEKIGAAGASTSGSGDGVAFVRRVIEDEHCGLVSYESTPGKGTTVTVRLPRRADPPLEPAGGRNEPKPAERPSGRRKLAATGAFLAFALAGLLLAWLAAPAGNHIAVAADGSGDYTSIAEAVEAARPGATIKVAPGIYDEHLILDKSVAIVGRGNWDAVIRATRNCAVFSTATGAELRNLRIILDAEVDYAAVLVAKGDLHIEDCLIRSRGLACVEVAGGEPTVKNNLIYDGALDGIYIHGTSTGVYEGNTIRDCRGWGIAVGENASPSLGRNDISGCLRGKVNIYSGRGGR